MKIALVVLLVLSVASGVQAISLTNFIDSPAVRQFLARPKNAMYRPQNSMYFVVKRDSFDALSQDEKMEVMRQRLIGYPFGPKSSYIRFG